jgi:hypothetical protein
MEFNPFDTIIIWIDSDGNTVQQVLTASGVSNITGIAVTSGGSLTVNNTPVLTVGASGSVMLPSGVTVEDGTSGSGTALVTTAYVDSNAILISGNQQVSGIKNFADPVTVGAGGVTGHNLLQINGGTTPASVIAGVTSLVEIDSENPNFSDFQYRLSSYIPGAPAIILSKSRGMLNAPTSVSGGDWLGTNLYLAYNGSTWGWAAKFDAYIDGTVTSGSSPGMFVWATTPQGGNTPIERFRIGSNGLITISSLTANRVLITNDSKQLLSSSITDTEIITLSGIQSNIQTQLNDKASSSLSGILVAGYQAADTSMSGVLKSYTDTRDGVVSGALVSAYQAADTSMSGVLKSYTDTRDGVVSGAFIAADTLVSGALNNSKVAKAGDTMTGLLVLSADPTASGHAATKQYVDDQSHKLINIAFGSGTVYAISHNSGTWTTRARLIFPGSTFFKTIIKFSVIAYAGAANNSGSIRIQDVTNGNTVATISSITATSATLYSTTSISNVPTNTAIFEIQIQRNSGNSTIYCNSLQLEG